MARRRELLVLEDNPYGLLRYEGDPQPTLYSLDGGEYVIYLGTFSKILSPGLRLGWTAAPRPVLEKMNLGKGGADLCSSSLSQHFVVAYFAERDWRRYLRTLTELYRRRRDTMLDALAEHFPREATWTRPEGGLFIWATLPDYIDTTDLLARALREENVAFVPGRAAYLDGRGGSSMRLNFSGVGEDDIREGVRRIGKVISEQVGLYGTLTGAEPARRTRRRDAPPASDRAAERPAAAPAGAVSRVALLKGGALAGAQRLAALGAPRSQDALERLGHEVAGDRRRPRPRRAARGRAAPTSRSSRSTAAAARTARCRSCSSSSASPTPAPARPRASAAWTRWSPSTRCATPASRRPTSTRSRETAFRDLGAAKALPGDRGAARLPDRRQAGRPGLGARHQVRRARPPTCPAR